MPTAQPGPTPNSTSNRRLLVRARFVVPVVRPPIEDGAVLIHGARIQAVGSWRELSRCSRDQFIDLGDHAVMPGLVNAHSHLDYTHMAGQFPPPRVFTDWLKAITEAKAGWSAQDYLDSWASGAQMLLDSGTTTVGDIESQADLLPAVWGLTPLRLCSFIEMIGITGRRQPLDILVDAVNCADRLAGERGLVGLSPHAPYSTLPDLLRASASTSRRRNWRVAIHVAESALEFEMFTKGRGSMFDWLKRAGRDMSDCGLGTPVGHLDACGALADNLLAVHANYLGKEDAALLSRRRAHVVHCPRSHWYFGHDPFPLLKLSRAGVNICLGTDSLASVCKSGNEPLQLSMFEEMRALAKTRQSPSPRKIVEMATLQGARGLELRQQVGELSKGAFADLIVIPVTRESSRLYENILAHRGRVTASMIGGQWVLSPTSN